MSKKRDEKSNIGSIAIAWVVGACALAINNASVDNISVYRH